mmetsp:Transcript_24460/g.37930  ORF Transcript_24460/g.37930 Transcript_24460/m.37930 type:complete len:85 (+) Transcript_24460:14-268(+)
MDSTLIAIIVGVELFIVACLSIPVTYGLAALSYWLGWGWLGDACVWLLQVPHDALLIPQLIMSNIINLLTSLTSFIWRPMLMEA